MKNKGIRITYILIFFLILILILCAKGNYDLEEKNDLYETYEKIENYKKEYKDNDKYKNEMLISFKLKEFYSDKIDFIIKTDCQNIRVSIDGEDIYESSKITASNLYYNIELKPEYYGKMINISCENSIYSSRKNDIKMYYGDFVSVYIDELKNNIIEIVFIILEIVFGIICIFLFLLEGKNENKKEIFLGMFLICFAIWSQLNLGIIQAFFKRYMFFDILKIELIFLMLHLFLLFEKLYYVNIEKTKILYRYLVGFLTILTLICNIMLLGDKISIYGERIIKIALVLFFVVFSVMFYYGKHFIDIEKVKRNNKKNKKSYSIENHKIEQIEKYIKLGIKLLFIPCTLEIIFCNNDFVNKIYKSFFINEYLLLKIGVMIYMTFILTDTLEHVMKMIKIGKKTLKLEQLAKKDVLTQANSRTSYAEFIKRIDNDKELCNNKMIVSFDVNDLKLINDTYGHDAGDDYLIKCADIIKQAFYGNGESYRIGGDEFIVIIDEFDAKKFKESKEKLKYLQKRSMRKEDNRPISIAYGYAKFDEKLDNNILDTVKRADAMMYRRKNKIKARKRQAN